jgi:hypothetical protein
MPSLSPYPSHSRDSIVMSSRGSACLRLPAGRQGRQETTEAIS